MRRAVFLMLVLPACGISSSSAPDHPPLHFDVVVTQQQVFVSAIDPARPDATSPLPFAHPGECDETTDAWACDVTCPGAWLTTIRLEEDGHDLGDGMYEAPFGGGVGLNGTTTLDHAVLAVADDTGNEVEIPLPDGPRPMPTIDDVTVTATGDPLPDDIAITWHSAPAAASAVVELNGGYGGPRCHVVGSSAVTTFHENIESPSVGSDAFVTTLAAPSEVHTDFGDAEVWSGGITTVAVPPP